MLDALIEDGGRTALAGQRIDCEDRASDGVAMADMQLRGVVPFQLFDRVRGQRDELLGILFHIYDNKNEPSDLRLDGPEAVAAAREELAKLKAQVRAERGKAREARADAVEAPTIEAAARGLFVLAKLRGVASVIESLRGEILRLAIEDSSGDIVDAAKALGLHLAHANQWAKKHGLDS